MEERLHNIQDKINFKVGVGGHFIHVHGHFGKIRVGSEHDWGNLCVECQKLCNISIINTACITSFFYKHSSTNFIIDNLGKNQLLKTLKNISHK